MKRKKVGIPKKKKISAIKRLQQAKDILGKGKHRLFVHLKCIWCGKIEHIHTNDKSIYTEEVRKKFICLICK